MCVYMCVQLRYICDQKNKATQENSITRIKGHFFSLSRRVILLFLSFLIIIPVFATCVHINMKHFEAALN